MNLSHARHICIVTSSHVSRNPRVVREADALVDAGYDVRVVACQWMKQAKQADEQLLASRRWECHFVDYSRSEGAALFWWSRFRHYFARRLLALSHVEAALQLAIDRVVPEIISAALLKPANLFIGHNLGGLVAAVSSASRIGCRVGFDAEDFHSKMWLSQTGPSFMDRLAALIEERFLPHCNYLTAASPLIAEGYSRQYSIKLPETILNVFPLSSRPMEFRRTDTAAPLTLYWFSQTIGARRGLEDVIEAMGRSRSATMELHLRGDWQVGYEEELRAFAGTVGLNQQQIIWHTIASPEEMVRLACEYDVSLALEQPVSENRDICLTNKIFAYLLAGNAIVATATRGQKELLREIKGAAFYYEPGDVDALARQLQAWERDRSSLEHSRRCAWRFGSDKFNWDIEKKKFVSIVKKALSQSPIGL